MSKDSSDSESHSSKVTESVSYEHFGRELIFLEQSQSTEDERHYDSQWKGVLVDYKFRFSPVDFNDIMNHNKTANDEALAHFNTINSSVDIDRIGAKDWKRAHIHFIDET